MAGDVPGLVPSLLPATLSRRPDTIVDAFGPYVENKPVKEGLECIGEKFASPDHVGPKHVADFLEIGNSADREQLQRDAYERVVHMLENLGLEPQKVD